MSWATEERPERFEDVVGQDVHRTFLGNLIRRGQIGRSLIFHGPPGSGKTTLARIYARALNCLKPDTTSGSPCRTCYFCSNFGIKHIMPDYIEVLGGRFTNIEYYNNLIAHNVIPPPVNPGSRWRILFIDEVHALAPSAMSALLNCVEEPPDRVVFLFATTELDRVSTALQSRAIRLAIQPLPYPTALKYMRVQAAKHGLLIADEALKLLFGVKGGYPRDLVTGLEQLFDVRVVQAGATQTISADDARSALGIHHTDVLLGYLRALANGDARTQMGIWISWNETAREKIDRIRGFLLHVYYNNVLHVEAVIDPNIDALPRSTYREIVEAFRYRIQQQGRDLDQVWQELLTFWSQTVTELDEATLQLRVALFHSIVNRATDPPVTPARERTALYRPTTPRHESVSGGPVRLGKPPRPRLNGRPDPTRMSYAHVEAIVRAASFLMQEDVGREMLQDRRFTVHFTLAHRPLGCEDSLEAGRFVSEFNRNFDGWLTRKTGSETTFRLTVREYSPERGFEAHSVAVVPERELDLFEDWARNWLKTRVGSRNGGYSPESFSVATMNRRAWHDRSALTSFHWRSVRYLCASLDPGERDWNEYGKPVPLVDLMKIRTPHRRRGGPPPKGRAFSASEGLSKSTITRAERTDMALLSAFEDGQWEVWDAGWEDKELRCRSVAHKERDAAIEALEAEFPEADASKAQARLIALAQLRNSWPRFPYGAERKWTAWQPRSGSTTCST